MKRVDLFNSSGDEEIGNDKQTEIKMLAEAKRQKIKNLEGLAKELPSEQVATKASSIGLAPIYIDSDGPSSSSERSEINSESECDTDLYEPFDEVEDISEPLDEKQAFIKDFGNGLRRLDSSRASIDCLMGFALNHFNRADTVTFIAYLIK